MEPNDPSDRPKPEGKNPSMRITNTLCFQINWSKEFAGSAEGRPQDGGGLRDPVAVCGPFQWLHFPAV